MATKVWTMADATEMECYEFDPKGEVKLVLQKNERCVPPDCEDFGDELDDVEAPEGLDGVESPVGSDDAEAPDGLHHVVGPDGVNSKISSSVISEVSEVVMRVSSRHMILASPVFEAMLSGGFQEGTELQAKGKLRLSLPDDNPAAMSILLNIIHGRPSKVPRTVTLNLLIELTILVDKYELHEAVTMFSELWISGIKDVPEELNRKFVQCLYICYVFAQDAEYSRITEIAWRKSTSRISDELLCGLAIPEAVIDDIENRRLRSIFGALEVTNSLIKDYNGPITQCGHSDDVKAFSCDGMVLGGIIKTLSKAELSPDVMAPFTGISFESVSKILRGIQIPKFCQYYPNRHRHSDHGACRDFGATITQYLELTDELYPMKLPVIKRRIGT